MISRIVFVLAIFHSSLAFSQISDSEMETLKNKWRSDLREKGAKLAMKPQKQEGVSDFSDSIMRLFLEDTFVVENLLSRQLEKESTNLGINKANLACASEYEKLAEKYYAILMSKMKDDDKPILASWQSARKSSLETERTLIGKLMQEEYSGGGSIQSIIYTKRLMNTQKEYVLTIIDYLSHLI
jgi:hypothetical protein